MVLELYVIKRRISSKKYKYILPSEKHVLKIKLNNGQTDNPRDVMEIHRLVIKQLVKGDFFNLGETRKGLLYISNGKASMFFVCLFVCVFILL